MNYGVTGLSGSSTSLVGVTMQSNGTLVNSAGSPVGYYGWVVQNVQINYSVHYHDGTNADDTKFATDPADYPTNFYEAWLVGLDGTVYGVNQPGGDTVYLPSQSFSPSDSYTTPQFLPNTIGYFNAMGTVNVYSTSAVGNTSPAGWGNLPVTIDNPSTTSQPAWWAGSGWNHDVQMNWE